MTDKSQSAIIEAAFSVLSKTPAATLADIAKAAGVGRATLHRHFSGRADLISALARIAMAELDAAIDAATKDARSYSHGLELTLQASIQLADRQWFLANETFDNAPDIAAAYIASRKELEAAIDQAKKEGTVAVDLPTSWVAGTFEALIYVAWEQVQNEELTPKQATALAWRTFTSAMMEVSK
ncbi:MAG: helix-turn-helix domain-containing protein [Pseudomonadota bacterium]